MRRTVAEKREGKGFGRRNGLFPPHADSAMKCQADWVVFVVYCYRMHCPKRSMKINGRQEAAV